MELPKIIKIEKIINLDIIDNILLYNRNEITEKLKPVSDKK